MSLIRVCKPIAWADLEASEIREAVLKAAAEFYPQLLSSDAVIALRESSRERIAGGEGAQAFLVKIFTAMPEPGSLESCLEEIRRVTEAAGPKNIFLFFPWMDNRPGLDKDIRLNGP